MKMTELQMRLIKENLKVLTSKDCFYKEKFKDIDVEAIQTNDNQTKSGVIDLWMDSLVNNREPEISGRSALTAMRAVFASLRSSELGTAVEIPENR